MITILKLALNLFTLLNFLFLTSLICLSTDSYKLVLVSKLA